MALEPFVLPFPPEFSCRAPPGAARHLGAAPSSPALALGGGPLLEPAASWLAGFLPAGPGLGWPMSWLGSGPSRVGRRRARPYFFPAAAISGLGLPEVCFPLMATPDAFALPFASARPPGTPIEWFLPAHFPCWIDPVLSIPWWGHDPAGNPGAERGGLENQPLARPNSVRGGKPWPETPTGRWVGSGAVVGPFV